MMEKNVFAVGEIATQDKFIGRSKEAERLSSIFDSTVSLHLVGATRIGKSSLVNKVFSEHEDISNIFEICLDLSIYENAFQFWFSLCEEIADAIESKRIESPTLEKHKDALLSLTDTDSNWYAKMRRPLTKTLEELKKNGYKVVVALDEFDAVPRVFEGNAAYYQMLRSLFSEGKYGFNGVIVSRRNLEVLEAKTEDVSTFHGVFDTLRLKAFDEVEMEEFMSRLNTAGAAIDEAGKDQFIYFTGGIPYLCCMLANQLLISREGNTSIAIGSSEVIEAHRACQPVIWRYYNDLISRLEEDNHLEPLVYLAFDEMKTLSYVHNRENMIAMGYLVEQSNPDGTNDYYAYSKGFMVYLRRRPLKAPTWDLLSASEKKLKSIFASEYPLFKDVRPINNQGSISQSDKDAISQEYQELRFNKWSQSETFLRDTASYMEDPVLLDVLAVTWVIDEIIWFWDRRFAQYFDNDDSWKGKLSEIRRVRNPMAHAHGDCISEDDLAKTNRYMQELLGLGI